jgi:hypothetical protein
MNALLIMTSAYTSVAYMGWKIWKTLAQKRHIMSKSTSRAHDNLSKILILQASYPCITVATPLFIANFLPMLNIETMYVGFGKCLLYNCAIFCIFSATHGCFPNSYFKCAFGYFDCSELSSLLNWSLPIIIGA